MRYLLAAGALVAMLFGSGLRATADPSATLPAGQTSSPTTATAPGAPQTSAAASATADDGPGTPVDSPDVAQWTAQLVHDEQKASAVHHAVLARPLSRFAGRILSRTTAIAKRLTRDALRFLGTPYLFGGTNSAGFDCSGFVQHVFAMLGVPIPRTADAQYYAGGRVKGVMKAGDLVFFQTYAPGPSHVGIYLGNGRFVHASSSHGVMVSNLRDSYWAARYLGAKRLISRL